MWVSCTQCGDDIETEYPQDEETFICDACIEENEEKGLTEDEE